MRFSWFLPKLRESRRARTDRRAAFRPHLCELESRLAPGRRARSLVRRRRQGPLQHSRFVPGQRLDPAGGQDRRRRHVLQRRLSVLGRPLRCGRRPRHELRYLRPDIPEHRNRRPGDGGDRRLHRQPHPRRHGVGRAATPDLRRRPPDVGRDGRRLLRIRRRCIRQRSGHELPGQRRRRRSERRHRGRWLDPEQPDASGDGGRPLRHQRRARSVLQRHRRRRHRFHGDAQLSRLRRRRAAGWPNHRRRREQPELLAEPLRRRPGALQLQRHSRLRLRLRRQGHDRLRRRR